MLILSYCAEEELDEIEEEDEILAEIEVEQDAPVVPIPAPVEPPVKRKRGRPPKNRPERKFLKDHYFQQNITVVTIEDRFV